jgi:formylglycine-generating enzyme required for sulfatase activity
MAGNIWEWLEDLYREDKNWRGLRGGAWNLSSEYLACAFRYYGDPDDVYDYFGFRVVCAANHRF